MKYLKLFEVYSEFEYMVAKLDDKDTLGRINKYVGNVHLLETVYSDKQLVARAIQPETSPTFNMYYVDDNKDISKFIGIKPDVERYSTDYGFVYIILYKTKNEEDAINRYNMIVNSKKYNL